MTKWIRRTILGLIIALCTGCVLLATLYYAIRRNACSDEVLQTVSLSGVTFEVESSSCDLIAKDYAVNVYAMRDLRSRPWPFSRWGRHRALIFRYDPGKDDDAVPSISRPSQSTIRISIPEISSVMIQSREWEKMSISYEIGKVYYPAKSN